MKQGAFIIMLFSMLASAPAHAEQTTDQIGLSGSTTPPTPDCQATAGQPVLLIRNLIEGTTVTGVYAKPYSDYNEKTDAFLSVGSLWAGNSNLLGTRVLKGKKFGEVFGTDDDNPGRCGFPINLGQFGYRKACSPDKVENLYQITLNMERDSRKFTVTLTKNVCDETMLDLLPGLPSNGSDKIAAGQGLSGTTPDCETTVGVPKLLARNLIEGTTITSIRARPLTDYNRQSKTFVTNAKGANVIGKPIPGKPLNSVLGDGNSCGVPINFGKFDFRTDCPKSKFQNLYEMTVNLTRGDKSYMVTLTKNVCDETMLDVVPGIPAANPQAVSAK